MCGKNTLNYLFYVLSVLYEDDHLLALKTDSFFVCCHNIQFFANKELFL